MATFSDNFNRSDVYLDLDSPAWLDETLFSLRVLSNRLAHDTEGGFGIAALRYPTACDTVTQYAGVTLAVVNSAAEAIGVIVRASGAGTFYDLAVSVDTIGIEKYVSGSYAAIGGGTGQYLSTTNAANDVFELRVVTNGSAVELRVYKNSSLVTGLGTSGVLSDSDGNRITTGNYVGVFGYSETGTTVIRGDDFVGGDYTVGGSSIAAKQQFYKRLRQG